MSDAHDNARAKASITNCLQQQELLVKERKQAQI